MHYKKTKNRPNGGFFLCFAWEICCAAILSLENEPSRSAPAFPYFIRHFLIIFDFLLILFSFIFLSFHLYFYISRQKK